MSSIIQPNDPLMQQAMIAEQQAQLRQQAIQQLAEQVRIQLLLMQFVVELNKDSDVDLENVRTKTADMVNQYYPTLMELLGFKAVQ